MRSLVCPICKSPLKQNEVYLRCRNCEKGYLKRNNIFDFLEEDFYWGEISREYMERVINLAQEKGYKAALKDVCLRYPDLEYYLLSNARIDWLFHCLSTKSSMRKTCLDLGSGWGSLTFPLAEFYKEVWSLEAVWERIKFQKIRNDQEGRTNVRFARADMSNLPFSDNYFDLVVSSGVLEWVGLVDSTTNPKELQLNFLREVWRVLKQGGCLYIGIENRFGMQFLLGERDHSGLPFTSILPRKLADLSVKLFRKTNRYERDKRASLEWKDYRTFTYTFRGYENLLRRANFGHMEFYWVFPSYNQPKFAGRLHDAQSFKFLLHYLKNGTWWDKSQNKKKFLLRIASCIPAYLIEFLLCLFSPSFLIYAYKGLKRKSFETKLLNSGKSTSSFLRMSGAGGITSIVNYFLLKDGKLWKVNKFPRFKEGYRSLEQMEKLLYLFNNLSYGADNLRRIGGIPTFVEDGIKANPCEVYNIAHNKMALKWLLKFQNQNRTGFWNFQDFEREVKGLVNYLSSISLPEEIRRRTMQRLQFFLYHLQEVELERTSEHGDFWHQNILIDGEKVHVLDWEYYKNEGNPLFDFCFFIISGALAGTRPFESFYKNFVGGGRYTPILCELIKYFCNKKRLPPQLVYDAVPYVLVRCVRRHDPQIDNWDPNFSDFKKLIELWELVHRKIQV